MKVTRSSVRRSKCLNYQVGDCVTEELSSEIDFKKEEMMANVGSNTRMQRVCNNDKRVTCGSSEMNCSQQVAKGGIDSIESINEVDVQSEGKFEVGFGLCRPCVSRSDENECGYWNCYRKTLIGEKRMMEHEEECKSIRRRTIEQESSQSPHTNCRRESRGW